MNFINSLQAILLVNCGVLSALTLAESHDQHDSRAAGMNKHVHGEATLNIAQEGDQLLIEFASPAMNLIGFEHAPRTDSQKDGLTKANQLLQKMDSLVAVNTEAACQQTAVTLTSPFNGEDHDNHHDDEHEDKHHEAHADEHHADDDHEKDHDDESDSAEHSEFAVSYKLQCSNPEKLTHFTLTAFGNFPATTTIDVQWATEQGQGAAETTAGKNVIQLPSK